MIGYFIWDWKVRRKDGNGLMVSLDYGWINENLYDEI